MRVRVTRALGLAMLVTGVFSALPVSATADAFGLRGEGSGRAIRLVLDVQDTVGQQAPLDTALTEATLSSAPEQGYAAAYPGWPGPILGNPGTVLEVFAPELVDVIRQASGQDVPNVPRSESRVDATSGEQTDSNTDIPGSTAETAASLSTVRATATVQGASPAPVSFGNATSSSVAELVGKEVITTVVAEVSDVQFGPVSIRSVQTTLRATSDGQYATSEGGTTVEGLVVGDVPLRVDSEGLHLDEETVPAASSDLGDDAIEVALEENGVQILPLAVTSTEEKGTATRVASGLVIRLTSPEETVEPVPLPGGEQTPGVATPGLGATLSLSAAQVHVGATPAVPSPAAGPGLDPVDVDQAPAPVPNDSASPTLAEAPRPSQIEIGDRAPIRPQPNPQIVLRTDAGDLRSHPIAPSAVLITGGAVLFLGGRLKRFYQTIVWRAIHAT